MLANVYKSEKGVVARYERDWEHSANHAWTWLTDNGKLAQWFSELSSDDLRSGGRMRFDMGDGTFENMTITDFSEGSILEYEWGEDSVRFEIEPRPNGCRLVLIETIRRITEHTPKDLAGWHVCLDVVQALMDGRPIPAREDEWKTRYEQYVQAIQAL
ncbi:SRPBCC family protein [Cohnella sp. LGH]|uniref:SRPBCC family protein n=1 Tax=Cohnella sp. LGH TaxID=1619153 RepID=UPI001ADA1DC5|nr:SRPBCC family protein [Cohnella sp. LGH]QTH43291.1 SRPBCC family protein [Cohnella sp. LGH]